MGGSNVGAVMEEGRACTKKNVSGAGAQDREWVDEPPVRQDLLVPRACGSALRQWGVVPP